ncbi:hypothetical protein IV203_029755 [Nitzschia inconspicua]|uniref:DUF6824 domain-containing protein n=1 Tax=Nitzschia inconspicua TaxID=303405 RepID=A0A9K3K7B9_9STRA|nr:hypothetical protein IV203_004837 [Nitzschia inconspicua]KAG7367085.1 hypothetical protein IV203_029755 [Nitzschia inconspicua]
MVEMSGFKIPQLPPSIQRFGRCGGDEAMEDVSVRSSHPEGSVQRPSSTTSYRSFGPPSGVPPPAPSDRVKSFIHGVVSPFTACLQPTVTSCVSGGAGCGPDYSTAFRKTPAVAVVSPLVDRHPMARPGRGGPPPPAGSSYRDSRLSPTSVGEEGLSVRSKEGKGDLGSTSNPIPTENIEHPHSVDVLCGRGGSSNRHPGNIHFRELVAANKKTYVGLTKKQKMMLARQIVDVIRSTDPPGRFLAKDMDTGFFYDIGLPRSLEKTSQALREKNSNEVPEEQQVDGEGIETSVEAFQSLVKTDSKEETSECKQDAGESPESGTSKPSKKSPKNVETPSLVIPPNLMHIYGPEKERCRESDLALSPNGPPPMGAPYLHGSPYRQPYVGPRGPPTPPHPYHGPPSHHRHPAYPSTSPHGGFPEHGRYYYHPHYPPHTPPYRHYPYPEEHRHPHYHQLMDNREAYSEYYSKSAERESPSRLDVQGHSHPPSPHYGIHGYPPSHPLAPQAHRGRPGAPAPPLPPSGYGRPASSSSGGPMSPPYRPSPYSGHSSLYHRSGMPPPPPPAPVPSLVPPRDGSANIIYRTPSNGYVRGNSEVSPERQREIKRQRDSDGHIRRVSESSLSSAVRNSLTLEERVVRRERQLSIVSSSFSSAKSSTGSSATSSSSSGSDLMSPSSILQSRSRRSMESKDGKASPCTSESKVDYSGLSGLAALSTAAFLKLDEEM